MAVIPPRPKGPPLNALRAFEVAARLGSFAKAADELFVTSGAITQQVKTLEVWIGAKLFERHAKGVSLSPLGETVAQDFSSAFDALGGAVHKLHEKANRNVIQIAALPCIAQLWLSPRLPALRKKFPNLRISVTAMESPPNFTREAFDIGLFFTDVAASKTIIQIEQDIIFPVCAPTIADKEISLDSIDSVNLIGDTTWKKDWQIWLDCKTPVRQSATYSLYSLAVEEAVQGAGFLIAHSSLVRGFMRSGALVKPFKKQVVLDQYLTLMLSAKPTKGGSIEQLYKALINMKAP